MNNAMAVFSGLIPDALGLEQAHPFYLKRKKINLSKHESALCVFSQNAGTCTLVRSVFLARSQYLCNLATISYAATSSAKLSPAFFPSIK